MTTTDSSRTSGRIPDLRYQEAENDLRAAVRDLLDDRSPWPSVLARTESDEPNDAALWHSLAAELGCAGLLIPESLGGAGATYREAAVVAEETGRAVAPVPYLGSAVVATAALLGSGDELLPGLAEGRLTAALAVEFARMPPASVPGGRGAGAGGLATGVRLGAAQPGDPPGQARLTGTVTGMADALLADVLLVPADGVPFGLYAVDAGAPGVSRAAVVSLDATRPLSSLAFDSAPARPVATGEAAAQAVASALAAGAAMLASEQLGVAERCLDMTVAYVKERRQFSRPVITSAPVKAVTGSAITVTTNSATPAFSLIRMSAVTHGVNNDQRRIPLTPATTSGTTYTLQLPSDTGVLLPGNYMLFALDANGTPSVAAVMNIQ